MEIEYRTKDVYGNTLRYPSNGWAEFICDLAGTKTITDGMVQLCNRAGINLVEVN